jgi:hypothetical protein
MENSRALRELIRPGRSPLGPGIRLDLGAATGPLGELAGLLSHTNGFTTANAGVQVFRAGPDGLGPELSYWNAAGTWKSTYGALAEDLFCFGQDLFGVQFAIEDHSRIVTFDPETGDRDFIGDTLDTWAQWLLADLDLHAARSFATAWQDRHGPLDYDERLLPRQLFVLGGTYDDENLKVAEAAAAMRIRGPLAQQLSGLADGTRIHLSIDHD